LARADAPNRDVARLHKPLFCALGWDRKRALTHPKGDLSMLSALVLAMLAATLIFFVVIMFVSVGR